MIIVEVWIADVTSSQPAAPSTQVLFGSDFEDEDARPKLSPQNTGDVDEPQKQAPNAVAEDDNSDAASIKSEPVEYAFFIFVIFWSQLHPVLILVLFFRSRLYDS